MLQRTRASRALRPPGGPLLTLPERPNTCVIGAGASGLTAVKALGDWGIPRTCFEASDDIGGNWYFGNPNGRSSAYRSLHIDTSKNSISFADFPTDERYPDFPHHTQIAEYFDSYADHFGLREHIRFDTRVERAVRRVIEEGMIPQVEACLDSLRAGVRKTHMIDGRLRHSLLLKIYTDRGVGTEITLN